MSNESVKNMILLTWEEKLKHRLPSSYSEFMLLFGEKDHDIMKGTDFSFDENSDLVLKEYANELLKDLGMNILDEKSFVFAMHQGYIFFYFNLDEGDNPKVWIFSEIEKEHKILFDSFSLFVEAQMNG